MGKNGKIHVAAGCVETGGGQSPHVPVENIVPWHPINESNGSKPELQKSEKRWPGHVLSQLSQLSQQPGNNVIPRDSEVISPSSKHSVWRNQLSL